MDFCANRYCQTPLPEEDYEYHGGSHGFYACRGCGLRWAVDPGNVYLLSGGKFIHFPEVERDEIEHVEVAREYSVVEVIIQSGILYPCDCDLGSWPVRLECEGGSVTDWQECRKCKGKGYFEGGDDD